MSGYDYDLTDPEDVAPLLRRGAGRSAGDGEALQACPPCPLQEAEMGLPQMGGKRAFGEPGGRRVRDPDKDDDDQR